MRRLIEGMGQIPDNFRVSVVEEVSAVAHFPALLLLVGFVVATGAACQPHEDSAGAVHNQELPTGAVKYQEAQAPLLMARRALEESKHELAYYAVLHAIRADPENPSVFDFVLTAADAFLKADPPELRDFGEDLLLRAELLLPYQPIAALEESWGRWSKALEQLDTEAAEIDSWNSISGSGNRIDSLREEVVLAASRHELPPRARIALLQQARDELQAWGASNALRKPHPGDTGSAVWQKWHKLFDEIDLSERQSLADLFCAEKAADMDAWLSASSSLIHGLSLPEEIGEAALLMERAAAVRQFVRAGVVWERDLELLREAGVGELHCQLGPGDHRVTPKGRIRELQWRYSYGQILPWLGVLASVQFVEREGALWRKQEDPERLNEASKLVPVVLSASGHMPAALAEEVGAEATEYLKDRRERDIDRATAMLRLILHLVVDRDLLEPYVHSQFEESWRKQAENLDGDGRLIASKLRVWLELR